MPISSPGADTPGRRLRAASLRLKTSPRNRLSRSPGERHSGPHQDSPRPNETRRAQSLSASLLKRLLYWGLLVLVTAGGSCADEMPWRATLYAGAATRLNTTQIFLRRQVRPDDFQLGLILDRDITPLGAGFTLLAEAGIARFLVNSDQTTIDLGLGVRYDFALFGVPLAVGAFTGPSWADNPPVIPTGTWHGAPIDFR